MRYHYIALNLTVVRLRADVPVATKEAGELGNGHVDLEIKERHR